MIAKFVVVAFVVVELVISTLVSPVSIAKLGSVVVEDSSRNTLAPIRGPIPWNAIYQYCLLLRLSEEMIEDMIYHVRELDNAYLSYQDKKGK